MSCVNRCGGARDKRASLDLRLLGRLEITSGWSHIAKYIPGVQNVIADGNSRWPKAEIASNLRSLVTGEWTEQDINDMDPGFLYSLLQPVFLDEYIDDKVSNAMT